MNTITSPIHLPHVDFYVYILCRENGEPFYVGKGRRDRWEQHEKPYLPRAKNIRKERLCAKLMRTLGFIPKKKIAEGLCEREAHALERKTIASIGRGKNGPLLNLTEGGEGFSDPTPESKAKFKISMKAARQRPGYKEKISAAIKAVRSTPESRALTSKLSKERLQDPEIKKKWFEVFYLGSIRPEAAEKRRISLIKAYEDPLLRAKISAVHKGKRKSAATRVKMSQAQKNRSPETNEKIAASRRGKKRSPEIRLTLSKAAKVRWSSQDEREKQKQRFLGKRHTPSSLQKMRSAQQRRRVVELEAKQLGLWPIDIVDFLQHEYNQPPSSTAA